MANNDLVVSTETGGLGNRLKSWVSSMRLGADSRVHWPVTKNMPAPFGELFVNDCGVDAVPPGAAVYGSWRLAVLPQDEPYLPRRFRDGGCRRASARARPRQGVVDADGATHRSVSVHGVSEAAFAPLHARRCAAHRPRIRAHTAVLSRGVRRALPPDRGAAGDRRRCRRVGCGQPGRRCRRRASADLARRRSPAPQISPAGAASPHAAPR